MNRLFYLIKKANGLLLQHLNDICINHGLTGKQFLLLRFFYQNQDQKEHILQTKIQNNFRLRRSTITSVLQTLEKKGMIVRKTDETDQRKKVVIMTDQAKDIIERIEQDAKKSDDMLLSIFSDEEYNSLVDMLDRICENLVKNTNK
ncbi:MAG TPA: MarR family transcriptional regulator [Clostridia bacterium]